MQSLTTLNARRRDPVQERQEQRRYELLREVYIRSGGDPAVSVSGLEAGTAHGMAREEIFRIVQFLSQHGYLRYLGAGPRVRVTPEGIEYLRNRARQRRSIR